MYTSRASFASTFDLGTVSYTHLVENWYFDLPAFADFLRARVAELEADPEVRPIVPQTVKEFLAPPVVYIKNEAEEAYLSLIHICGLDAFLKDWEKVQKA